VSIGSVLSELVSDVEGATGAIILASDGEAVQWHAVTDGERLRLRGAYVAVAVQSYRESTIREKSGAMRSLVLEYDGSSFVAQEIDNDCFVALELAVSANIGEALFRLRPAAAKLRSELMGSPLF
jgi:predicted regulator of Ras-like GTPase activity (Roadblock/LC7/MglB family)